MSAKQPHPQHRRLRRGGFTFVEVMTVMALLVVMTAAMLVLGQTGGTALATAESQAMVLTDAQRAITTLSVDLRNASAASLSCTGTERLRLTRVTGEAVEYTRTAAGLMRAVNAGAPALVASRITAFQPACSGEVVRFQVTAISNLLARGNTWTALGSQTVESQIWVQNP